MVWCFIIHMDCICVRSENNLQEDLFDQILVGRLEFPSPFWDNITDSAKVSAVKHTSSPTHLRTWRSSASTQIDTLLLARSFTVSLHCSFLILLSFYWLHPTLCHPTHPIISFTSTPSHTPPHPASELWDFTHLSQHRIAELLAVLANMEIQT